LRGSGPKRYLGVDIGGTKVIAGVGDADCRLESRVLRKTRFDSGGEVALRNVLAAAQEAVSAASAAKIEAIGISCGGPLDPERGRILRTPNLTGWDGLPVVSIFEKEFSAKAYLDNDANVAALGEAVRGAGRGKKSFAYFTVSTGIGGGFVTQGELFRGSTGNASEFGHQTILPDGPMCGCGNRGCLEALASGKSIARRAKELLRSGNTPSQSLMLDLVSGEIDSLTAKDVAKAARAGDRIAQSVWEEAAGHLGLGVANIINILNPERVIIGGGVAKAGLLLFGPVRRVAAQRALPDLARSVDIVRAGLRDDSGVVGAVRLAVLKSSGG
jgi:glucokinase